MELPKSESPGSSADAFDLRRIRRLVELMDAHGLSEIDLRQGTTRVRLRRGQVVSAPPGFVMPPAAAPPVAVTPVVPAPAPAVAPEMEARRFVEITSPMVGTVYAASAPNAEPYVQVGSYVEPDTTVCIIEAMKVYNEIPAGVSGTVVAILVENGEPVEFGRPLFRVDPSR